MTCLLKTRCLYCEVFITSYTVNCANSRIQTDVHYFSFAYILPLQFSSCRSFYLGSFILNLGQYFYSQIKYQKVVDISSTIYCIKCLHFTHCNSINVVRVHCKIINNIYIYTYIYIATHLYVYLLIRVCTYIIIKFIIIIILVILPYRIYNAK